MQTGVDDTGSRGRRTLYGSLYERLLWKIPSAAAHPFADVVETRAATARDARGCG